MITLKNVVLRRGAKVILDSASASLNPGEKIGLVGRNGAGKSTLFAMLNGSIHEDGGEFYIPAQWRMAQVAQDMPETEQSATSYVIEGDVVLQAAQTEVDASELSGDGDRMGHAYMELYDAGAHDAEARAQALILGLGFKLSEVNNPVNSFSGGWRMRLQLARALMCPSDLLLLDEPTNHLDLDSIRWLEDLLIDFKGSVVTITHDRAFLDRIATRIVELDRGQLRSYPGNFAAYRLQKEEQLAQEAVINAKADKLLAQEEVWVRKGVEARRTRSQSRIGRLEKLRETRAARRDVVGKVKMEVGTGGDSNYQGKIVAELQHVSKAFGDKVIARDFSATLLRGDKIGLLGPNGAGKTTLLKMILGELEPDSGTIRRGANLQVAYFDQLRDAIDLDATLEDFISPGSEWIEINGQRKHVRSYLGDFLFSPARAHSPVRSLSGGERNRLLLARLFARPATVLVLDEPTNDLDIETIDLLEELLLDYPGTVFLVSHDRTFLDNVVTSTIAYEGDGVWREFEGGVEDWLQQSQRSQALRDQRNTPTAATAAPAAEGKGGNAAAKDEQAATPKKKLSYKEQRELEQLPDRIAALEAEQQSIQQELADGTLYTRDPQRATALHAREGVIEEELLAALERWTDLAP